MCDGCTAAVTESRTLAGLCATSTARGRCGHPTPPPAPGSRFTSIGRQTSQKADSDRDHRWSRQRRLAEPLDDSGDVGHPAALTHLPVVPRARRRGLTPIRTPISSPCPSASTNKRAAQRVPASTQTCSAAIWGSSGRRFKSCQPDTGQRHFPRTPTRGRSSMFAGDKFGPVKHWP